MKLLLCSDLHASKALCHKIFELSAKADLVIVAGDIGHLRRRLAETIAVLIDIKTKTILVPGNSESYIELKEACSKWQNAFVLHGNGLKLDGFDFYGIGGGIPVTPFGSWSWDFSEDEAKVLLKNCPEEAVLISHSPPKGILDVSSSGQSLGSVAVKECIDIKKPPLVVCGHIHESSGKVSRYGDSAVINAGPHGIWFDI